MSRHDTPSPDKEGLFSRWSRRKQSDNASKRDSIGQQDIDSTDTANTDTASTAVARDRSAPDPCLQDTETAPTAPLSSEEALDDADEAPVIELPDPDSLSPDADISAFMQSDVDPALRQRALRKIFMGGEHSLRDGLDDYDQDFSNMRPLAKDVAETLRRWTHKAEESLDSLESPNAEQTDERGDGTLDSPNDSPLEPSDDNAVDDAEDIDHTNKMQDDSLRHPDGSL